MTDINNDDQPIGNADLTEAEEDTLAFFDAIYFEELAAASAQPTSQAEQDDNNNNDNNGRRKRLPVPALKHIKGHVDARQKKLRETIRRRRQKLLQKISHPTVIMTRDKFSFVLGVLLIMIIEFVLLVHPDQMGQLYTALLLPLMVARYIIYRADLYHYFMYDFCYYAQIIQLIQMHKYPDDIRFAKAMFSIANGPLVLAVAMWRNSLVFHSLDKMTSMFIHILPALVMFSQRWQDHISNKEFPLLEEMDETIVTTLIDFWWNPFVYYAIWQALYLVKTEIVSKKKLDYNTSIMTSLRWMVRKKTSASYKLLSRFGEHNQLPTFVCIQAVYTLATFLLCPLLWHSIWLHFIYILVIFIIALANGASYYFHVFAKQYINEIGKLAVVEENGDDAKSSKTH
uniref:Glycerophosphocholine acyltransferase 1 n=1 Tax=Skeletonema marinoi TaxID=267567 RepID=A0A7S2Q1C6_9STRA|mmetsp:Transcript_7765/g.13089  ORF Transcript_7765/g.13089 Transcript_7765/m.13089 type:complete len:399 (+) Transcript_7765:131-1327(+)